MLKRLGAYPRQNGLALALREIGRIERTLYALDWLEQPDLRRQATAELNKGESHNALSRAVCFHRLGRLHDRTAQSQQHRASGLALVTAAIVLWNTVYLGRALDAARRRGDCDPGCPARPPCPAGLAAHQPHRRLPLGRQHQPRTGRVQAPAQHGQPSCLQPWLHDPVHGPCHEPCYPARSMAYPHTGTTSLCFGQVPGGEVGHLLAPS